MEELDELEVREVITVLDSLANALSDGGHLGVESQEIEGVPHEVVLKGGSTSQGSDHEPLGQCLVVLGSEETEKSAYNVVYSS